MLVTLLVLAAVVVIAGVGLGVLGVGLRRRVAALRDALDDARRSAQPPLQAITDSLPRR